MSVPFVMGEAPGGFPLGVRPSDPDERDYQYPQYGLVFGAEELPAEWRHPDWQADDNQGAVSSCLASEYRILRRRKERRETGKDIDFSTMFIYALRGGLEGGVYRPNPFFWQGPGWVPRLMLNLALEYGSAPYELWPGLVEIGQETWPDDQGQLFREALPFRIASYSRVSHTDIPQMKSAAYTRDGVLYCVPVYDNFIPDSNGVIPAPKGNLRGYHAMRADGWKPGYWFVGNTWGKEWGIDGSCWIPWDYPASEVWALTDAPTKRIKEVLLTIGSKTMLVDGEPVEMDVAPRIESVPGGGRTLIPPRWTHEALGDEVTWFEGLRQVRIRRELPYVGR